MESEYEEQPVIIPRSTFKSENEYLNVLQDLTMHINVSGEQHTHSIKQLLKNISTNPESLKELSRWGLEIGSGILMVRICVTCFIPYFPD